MARKPKTYGTGILGPRTNKGQRLYDISNKSQYGMLDWPEPAINRRYSMSPCTAGIAFPIKGILKLYVQEIKKKKKKKTVKIVASL
jgi:hypothetical protein